MKIIAKNPFYRIIWYGQQKDFPIIEKEHAIKFLHEKIKMCAYASIRLMYEFERIDDENENTGDNSE